MPLFCVLLQSVSELPCLQPQSCLLFRFVEQLGCLLTRGLMVLLDLLQFIALCSLQWGSVVRGRHQQKNIVVRKEKGGYQLPAARGCQKGGEGDNNTKMWHNAWATIAIEQANINTPWHNKLKLSSVSWPDGLSALLYLHFHTRPQWSPGPPQCGPQSEQLEQ